MNKKVIPAPMGVKETERKVALRYIAANLIMGSAETYLNTETKSGISKLLEQSDNLGDFLISVFGYVTE